MSDRPTVSDGGEHPRATSGSTSQRWARVHEIFAAAMECDAGARDHLIDCECGDDAELRREVESLLAAHQLSGPVDRLMDEIAPAVSHAREAVFGWEGPGFGRYVILEVLGIGGMGLVYKARDERLGRQVALKFLFPHLGAQPKAKQRFLLEARAAAALDHPTICMIHEIGEAPGGHPFIAMPLYDGETLEARLTRGPLDFEEAAALGLQIAGGLQHAHEHGIVHRDVKPSNVMLLPDGTVKILDFGVAKVEDVALTDSATLLGTVAYMSPEQAGGGTVDHRTDVWSLGVLFYEMLAGTRPFHGKNRYALTHSILYGDPDPISAWRTDLPTAIDELVQRALDKLPEGRYQSMAAMAADLAALSRSARSSARAAALPPVARPARGDEATTIAAGGERRWVAVMVSLVSDYDKLVERLSPVELDQVVSSVRTAAAEVVRRHGGLVNQAIADEVVSLFGVPTAHEDDDLRAVRAAMELAQKLRGAGSSIAPVAQGCPVRVQSAVHVGLLVAQRQADGPRRYAITGAPVQVAASLARHAGADRVLMSPECRRLVAPFVEAEPSDPVVLGTDAGLVRPFRVIGESGLQTRLEASERAGLTPYTGRDGELATLLALLARARGGQGQVVTIIGEAGAGKSRLLYEFHERLVDAGVRMFQGRCRPHGGMVPYAPFVEILLDALGLGQRAAHEGSAEDIVARIRAIGDELEPFVSLYLHLLSIQSEAHHLQSEQLRVGLLDALTALFAVQARRATTVLFLEDWQWVDDASREALRRLMEIVATHALLIVVTSRPEPGALAECAEHATSVQLAPLDRDASTAVMRAVLRVARVSDDLARRVHQRTGGNPFFLEQVCQTLLEEEAVAVRDGETTVAGGVDALRLPDTVQAVIRARLDRLEQDSRDVLRVASVIGREFGRALLGDVLGAGAQPSHALERLKLAGLIQQTAVLPEPVYRFRHVLTQEVTYESLLHYQRRSLHERVGRAIQGLHPNPSDDLAERLAHHFAQAEAWSDAVHYGMQAAARADALSQFADALATLELVRTWVARLPDERVRADALADLLLQQERLSETLGLRGRQQLIVEELVTLLAPRGTSSRLAQAYLRQGDMATILGRFDPAERALNTALRMSRELGEAALESNALRSIGLLRWHEGRHADALRIAKSALAIDREIGDELAVAGDLINISIILRGMGETRSALASCEEALRIPALAQQHSKLLYALHNLANVHRAMGDLDQALACLRRADEIARVRNLPIARSFHLTSIAHILLQEGRIEDALQTYVEATEHSRRARHADGLAQSLRALGEVLFGFGRGAEALPHLKEAAGLFARLENRSEEADMWSRVATILERAGSMPEAEESWETARALRVHLGDARGELDALEGIARAARASSRARSIAGFEGALALAVALTDRRREMSIRNTLGILEWERGAYAESLRHYDAALRLVRDLGDRAHEGLILNSLGVVLSRLERYEEARTVLEQSIARSRETGQRLLEAQALGVLGEVCRACGKAGAAMECTEESLALRVQLGDRRGEGWMLHRLAELRAGMGDEIGARTAASGAAAIAAECGDFELVRACGSAERDAAE